ncbi:MAG: radical SAM protein, partial [Oscillospiraceae bacterium]|nr:radical SAM protein [Oscillospiraceae bacterium]
MNFPVAPAATEYLYRKATAAGVPLSGTFELTPVCNMDCKMCYVRLSKQEQEARGALGTVEQWLELAKKASNSGMLYLLLTGGEPFLYPGFRRLLEGLHAMGLLISINSNGTLIDAATVEWLKTCPPMRINITLYGASNETYSRLCGDAQGFTKVTNAIHLLKEAGIGVKLNCSLTPLNAEDLPKIAAFAEQNQLPLQVATYMFPPTRKDGSMVGKNMRFSPEDAAYYMAYSDYLTLGRERFLAQNAPVPSDPEDPCGQPDGVRCRAGKCSFWVTWQGNMLPCGMFPGDGGTNVFTEAFPEFRQIGLRRDLPHKPGALIDAIRHRDSRLIHISQSG